MNSTSTPTAPPPLRRPDARLQGVSRPITAQFPGRCRLCGGAIEVGSDLVMVKRASRLNEQRHGGCLSDQEKAFRRRAARRAARDARKAFQRETATLRLTGPQIQAMLANLPDEPGTAEVRAQGELALAEIRDRLARRRS